MAEKANKTSPNSSLNVSNFIPTSVGMPAAILLTSLQAGPGRMGHNMLVSFAFCICVFRKSDAITLQMWDLSCMENKSLLMCVLSKQGHSNIGSRLSQGKRAMQFGWLSEMFEPRASPQSTLKVQQDDTAQLQLKSVFNQTGNL